MLTIKPVTKATKNHNGYCGPSSLSIIAGVDTAEAARTIRHCNGKRSVKGTNFGDMIAALRVLGYRASPVGKFNTRNKSANPTLAAWLDATDTTRGTHLYLVCAGWHWQVVQGSRYCCGLSGGIVGFGHRAVKRRGRVTGVWRIEAAPELAEALPPPAARLKTPRDSTATKTRKLARKHDIEIQVDDGQIVVWGPTLPDWIDEEGSDPYYGDHYAESWQDALGMVEEYVRLIERKPHWFNKERLAA